VDVRLIAATNRPLAQEMAAGRFRADLFYRLQVVTLALPPLRERPGDVELLVQHFVTRAAEAEGRAPITLEPGALFALRRYPWPGNVRELENELRRLTALHAGERVTVAELAERVRAALLVERAAGLPGPRRPGLHAAVAALERRMIAECLVRLGGNKSRAARDLGLSRQGLAKKMRRYGLGFELSAIACEMEAVPTPDATGFEHAGVAKGSPLAGRGSIS
jgi:two-component system response regulator HydG